MKHFLVLGLLCAGALVIPCVAYKELLPIVVLYGTEKYDPDRFLGLSEALIERAKKNSILSNVPAVKNYLAHKQEENPLAIRYLKVGDGSPEVERGDFYGVLEKIRDALINEYAKKNIILLAAELFALLARCTVQEYFTVKGFPSIDTLGLYDGPQAGQFGIPKKSLGELAMILENWFVSTLVGGKKPEDATSYICYKYPWVTKPMSNKSFLGFWNAPDWQREYLTTSPLALLNNQVRHDKFEQYRNALKKIRRIHLEGFKGGGEALTLPEQSSIFGYYKPNLDSEKGYDTDISWDFLKTDQYQNSEERLGLGKMYDKKQFTYKVQEGPWSPTHPGAIASMCDLIENAQQDWLTKTE